MIGEFPKACYARFLFTEEPGAYGVLFNADLRGKRYLIQIFRAHQLPDTFGNDYLHT